jgi:hypothetical protein
MPSVDNIFSLLIYLFLICIFFQEINISIKIRNYEYTIIYEYNIIFLLFISILYYIKPIYFVFIGLLFIYLIIIILI